MAELALNLGDNNVTNWTADLAEAVVDGTLIPTWLSRTAKAMDHHRRHGALRSSTGHSHRNT